MEEFKEYISAKVSVLYKNDIERLVKLFQDALPNCDIKITVTYNGTQIVENNLNDIFNKHDIPRIVKELEIVGAAYGKQHPFQSIEFISSSFGDFNCYTYITGIDQTWVLGTSNRFNKYLKTVQPWYFIIKKYFWPIYLLTTALTSYLLIKSITNMNIPGIIISGCLYALNLTISFLTIIGRLFRSCTVYSNNRKQNSWGINHWALILTALLLIVAVIQLFR